MQLIVGTRFKNARKLAVVMQYAIKGEFVVFIKYGSAFTCPAC